MRLALVALLLAACEVGTVEPGGGTGGDNMLSPDSGTGGGLGSGSGSGSGSGTVGASALNVTFTTSAPGGTYAPRNIVAVWVEGTGGTFVKTIGRWADIRRTNLVAWTQKSGSDADAVSGATRSNHTNPLKVTWDLKNKLGTVVPDGTYTIRMEVADQNTTSATNNNEGTFTFIKGTAPQSQTNQANGGFTNVSIDFTP